MMTARPPLNKKPSPIFFHNFRVEWKSMGMGSANKYISVRTLRL
jgi:hypothetical protein